MRYPYKILFCVIMSHLVSHLQIVWHRFLTNKYPWNGVGGGIGEAAPNNKAITFCAPSPVAITPFIKVILIPHTADPGVLMAEKEGFEPPVPFQIQLISSQSHSTTLPLLLKIWARKSCLRALASLDYRSVSNNSSKSWCRNEQSR